MLLHSETEIMDTREMAQLIKCLLYKNKDLNSTHQNPQKKDELGGTLQQSQQFWGSSRKRQLHPCGLTGRYV